MNQLLFNVWLMVDLTPVAEVIFFICLSSKQLLQFHSNQNLTEQEITVNGITLTSSTQALLRPHQSKQHLQTLPTDPCVRPCGNIFRQKISESTKQFECISICKLAFKSTQAQACKRSVSFEH